MITRLFIYAIFSFFFLSNGIFAQSEGRYIYVEIRGLSLQRGVPELKEQLKAIPAIDSIEYCDNVGLLILHTQSKSDSTRSKVNSLLHSLNYKYTIKSEIPIEDARKICSKNSQKK